MVSYYFQSETLPMLLLFDYLEIKSSHSKEPSLFSTLWKYMEIDLTFNIWRGEIMYEILSTTLIINQILKQET